MKSIFKRCGFFLIVLCTATFTCISASEITKKIEEFKKIILHQNLSFIKSTYDKYTAYSENTDYRKNLLDTAVHASVDWINTSAPKKEFGIFMTTIELEKRTGLKTTLISYNNQSLAKTIDDLLLMRTLFYPTKEEFGEIQKNTDGLKDKLKEKLSTWLTWHQLNHCVYTTEDIDIEHLKEVLTRLNVTTTVDDLELFGKKQPENITQEIVPTTNYFKPVVITLSLIALGIVGFWSFKKLCPNQFSTLNAKISSLFKKLPHFPFLGNRQKYQRQGLYKFSM